MFAITFSAIGTVHPTHTMQIAFDAATRPERGSVQRIGYRLHAALMLAADIEINCSDWWDVPQLDWFFARVHRGRSNASS